MTKGALHSTQDYAVDRGRTILVLCRHCSYRMLTLDEALAAAAIDRHLAVAHRIYYRRRGTLAP